MINRFSSRKGSLADAFFKNALTNAVSYDRIAGYFSSSVIEIAGEHIEAMEGKVRIICNSQLQAEDVKFIKDQPQAMKLEWCEGKPEEELKKIPERLNRLYKFLKSGKIEVRVLPNDVFGLIHGKAGVITKKDGSQIAFMGSMNETYHGWGKGGNYEIAWVDDDNPAIEWVQDEFNALWTHPLARPLTNFIIEDIKRIAERKVIYDITEWRETDNPASTVIEAPVYRKEFGLWEHQKYFVDLAYKAHKSGLGARYVLADMVGLGKTIQLALAAMLMALDGDKPILVIAPKTLIWQWQDELLDLLDMPSAVWNGKCWVDENKMEHPAKDENALGKCPRRVGIISQGLIVRSKTRISPFLLSQQYECVVVDEAHRSRRKNLGKGKEGDNPQPNNLMAFLLEVSRKTKSLLLATATPVQIHPIEAWDLLYVLSQGNSFVLGNEFSNWQREKLRGIKLITGQEEPDNDADQWDWLRNPLPPADEKPQTFGKLRRSLGMGDLEFTVKGSLASIHNLSPLDQRTVRLIFSDDFIRNNNPFIRHIIRRERRFLEETINPDTNLPYLKPIKVTLFGEEDDQGLQLTTHLSDAYSLAEQFAEELGKRVKSSGFIKTMLLRRVCSSMYAGLTTGIKMLNNWENYGDDEDDEDLYDDEGYGEPIEFVFKQLSKEEISTLDRFVKILEEHQQKDPKYDLLKEILFNKKFKERWIDLGCIVFSQYYDTIKWVCDKVAQEYPELTFGLYAGSDKSGIYENGFFHRNSKEEIKKMVRRKELNLLFGTDAASEGLNLQALGTLINLDLPWNPTRLEQRKGRIQRIGQEREEVFIYNMRYRGSVEDRVHQLLANRLKNIESLFGQIPDTLEDVWIEVALKRVKEADKKIQEVSESDTHPFYNKYQNQGKIKPIDWESCTQVLDGYEKRKYLMKGW